MSDVLLRILAEASLRMSLVAGFVGVILVALRVRASALRHDAWRAVLGAMLLMPILQYWVASIPIPISAPTRRIAIPADLATPRPVPSAAPMVNTAPELRAPAAGPPAAPMTPDRPLRGRVWPSALLLAYGIGVLVLLSRLALGWRAAAHVTRVSRRIPANESQSTAPWPGDTAVYESNLVAAPVTVGVFAPSIILPPTWRLWPDDELRAVLAHEVAHVRRRDPLVRFVGHFNLCVFWFHPLAWWLQRKLAATAEHACDDAAVGLVGGPRRYAEIVLDMAEAMRRNGGRLLSQGVGVHAGNLVGQRIERLLRGNCSGEPSRIRKAAVAAGCAAAVFFAAACRPQAGLPAPLREAAKPELSAEQVRRRDEARLLREADRLTPKEVSDLEAALRHNPDDLVSARKLILFYWARVSPVKAPDEKTVARRRAHILWLIDTHPASELAGSVEARLFPEGFGSLSDPRGQARAKELWLTRTKQADASAAILANAAGFFETSDKALAEELLLRAQALDPKGPWSARLGKYYAAVLAGRYVYAPGQALQCVVAAEPHGPYADSIRQKLAESKDDIILTSAALDLLRTPRRWGSSDEPGAMARPWLERALLLNPGLLEAQMELVDIRYRERLGRAYRRLGNVAPISQYQAVAALPDNERFELLGNFAVSTYREGEGAAQYDNLKHIVRSARQRSKRYAEDLLNLAPRFREHPDYGAAIYKANMVLASLAFRDGDRQAAVRYMQKAAKAPASEELRYSRSIASWGLLKELLNAGERESVIEFLEKMARMNVARRDYLRDSAAAIRGGQMPTFDRRPYW